MAARVGSVGWASLVGVLMTGICQATLQEGGAFLRISGSHVYISPLNIHPVDERSFKSSCAPQVRRKSHMAHDACKKQAVLTPRPPNTIARAD